MTEREIGAQAALCHNCDTQLKAVDQPDGGVAYEVCPNCYGGSEQAATQQTPERASEATVTRETGTNVDDTKE